MTLTSLGRSISTGPGRPERRDAKGLGEDARNVRGAPDDEAVLHDRQRDPEDVDFLEGVGAHQRRADLAGDRDHRHAVEEGVGDAGDEVGRARPGGREADAGLAGDPAIGVGGERRGLLVADQDVVQARTGQRVVDRHDRAARIAEDVLDALALQRLDDQPRAGDRLPVAARHGRRCSMSTPLCGCSLRHGLLVLPAFGLQPGHVLAQLGADLLDRLGEILVPHALIFGLAGLVLGDPLAGEGAVLDVGRALPSSARGSRR